jgi:hypothetical protein
MFADSEAIVRTFLDDALDVPVVTKVPKSRPGEFVRVWRTGGAASSRVLDRPIITVQAWAANSARASDLASRCRDLLLGGYTGMRLVRYSQEVSGLYYDPDPDSGIDRYTFAHQLNVRATF